MTTARDNERPDAQSFTHACHTCPTSAAIQAGKHTTTPWKKLPCSRCRLAAEPSKKGKSFVSLDASYGNERQEPDLDQTIERLDEQPEPKEPDPDSPQAIRNEMFETFRQIARDLFDMHPTTRAIVLGKIGRPERSVVDIGRELGIGKSAVHDRLGVVAKRHPWIQRAIRRPYASETNTEQQP